MRAFMMWRLYLVAMLAAYLLAACGGGGGSTAAPIVSSAGGGCSAEPNSGGCTSTGQQTCPSGDTGAWPNCVVPPPAICAVNGPEVGSPPCTCPSGTTAVNGICTPNPLPACNAFSDIAACQCEAPNTANDLGVCIPPPTQCPTDEYGTPPACEPIPQCSLVVGGYWGGPAAGCECPASETGTYPQCVGQPCPAGTYGSPGNCLTVPVCNVPGSYWGGNACECPAEYTGTYPSCLPPPTACSTFDPNATGNFPNCSCPAGEVWDSSQCITPTISCSSYPPANGVWPSCSCPVPQMWNNTALACQAPSQPDTLACTAGTDSGGNPDSTCVYSSPNPVDECSVWDMTATSGPYVLTGSGQGMSQGTVQGPSILQPVTFSLQCTLTTGTTATVTP